MQYNVIIVLSIYAVAMAIIQTHVIQRPLKMSQYQCRDYWSTVSGYEEFHDIGSLCLATLTGNCELLSFFA